MYAKVRIQHRSTSNRRKRDIIKKTPKTVDRRQMMTDPDLRRQVAKAIVAVLPPIPDDTWISDIAIDMADVMLSTAAEQESHSTRSIEWCGDPCVEAEMNAAWQQREDVRRRLRV